MRQLTSLAIVISVLLITACANKPQSAEAKNDQQMLAISHWHQCVDDSLESLGGNTAEQKIRSNPNKVIERTLFVCQGYRLDVLDTFPQRLQDSLEQIMVRQTYESGYTKYAELNGIALPISPVTFDKLRRNKFQADQ